MTTDVVMPQLGESVVEGTILRWHKQVGDTVTPLETLLEISTDKVDAEIPAPAAGVLLEILVPEGQTVAKGTKLAVIGEPHPLTPSPLRREGEMADAETPSFATLDAHPVAQSQPHPPPPSPLRSEGEKSAYDDVGAQRAAPNAQPPWGEGVGVRAEHHPHITPVVARMAADYQIDLSQIQGTGHEGRVTKKDVEAYLAARNAAPAEPELPPWERPGSGDLFKPTIDYEAAPPSRNGQAAKADRPHPPAPSPLHGEGEAVGAQRAAPNAHPHPPAPSSWGEGEKGGRAVARPYGTGAGSEASEGTLIPLTPMRRVIAERLTQTAQTVPMVSTVFEVDLSAVLAHRDANRADFEAQGAHLTLTAYFALASVVALRAVPALNSEWRPDGIFMHRAVHLGIAVALDQGLIVPVVRHADGLNLLGMARAVNDSAARARAGQLAPDDTQGSTFTITNHGIGGSLVAQPILNAPNAGILGVGTVEKRVKVLTDAQGRESLAVRPCVYLSLTFDHRLADGAEGDAFLRTVKDTLEGWA